MSTGFQVLSPMRLEERFKGFFDSGLSTTPKARKLFTGEKSWSARCKYYDDVFERHSLAKGQIFTIAGQLVAEGVFTEAVKNAPRAQEAKERCDDLNEQIGLDKMLYTAAVDIAKHGSHFWEKTWEPDFDVTIIPMQEAVEPAEQDDLGNIVRWRQGSYGVERAFWGLDEIVHFAWNPTSRSWPYGTSLLVGLDAEFDTLGQLEDDIKEYMHKQAFPKDLWQVGDKDYSPSGTELTAVRSKIKNWSPGEEFVTSYTINHMVGGTGERTIANLNDVLAFLKDQCVDGLMVPPISKQWSSTMASAREMMPWARANLITPMQRLIRREVETQIYKPYLESLGYSVKLCPKLRFEPPDAHLDERAELWATLVGSSIVPAEYAAQELGFDLEQIKAFREEAMRRQAEKMQLMKVQFPQQQEPYVGGKKNTASTQELLMEADDEEGRWVTINGVHVLIKTGETPEQAFKRTTGKDLDGDKTPKDIKAPSDKVVHDEKMKVITAGEYTPDQYGDKFRNVSVISINGKELKVSSKVEYEGSMISPEGEYKIFNMTQREDTGEVFIRIVDEAGLRVTLRQKDFESKVKIL